MDEIVDVNTLFGPLPAASVDLAIETLLALMAQRGIGAACTLSTLGLLLDPTVGNAATRAACAEDPQLIPVATLNPTMFFGDADPLLRLSSEGFKIVRFFPQEQNWPLHYQPFHALLESLQQTQLPVMVNVSRSGDITTLQNFVGFYPTIILAGVNADLLPEAIAVLRRQSDWMLETSHLFAIGSMKLVVDTVGAERLLFGSGAPAQSLAAALNTLNYAGLSEATRHKILSANARRVL